MSSDGKGVRSPNNSLRLAIKFSAMYKEILEFLSNSSELVYCKNATLCLHHEKFGSRGETNVCSHLQYKKWLFFKASGIARETSLGEGGKKGVAKGSRVQ